MPSPPPSITLDPAPHPALNYAGLRAEALELLGRLCGDQWSDFNSHDPGITILEQLCFALTELAYRSQWSMEDLLSTGADWQPAAAEILSGDPVTPDDLVALLRALGCQAVQVEAQEQPELHLYFRPSTIGSALVAGDLELDAEPLGSTAAGPPQPVVPRGVWRVAAQLGPASLLSIAQRLHGARLLGRDFHLVSLTPFEVVVKAELELHAAAVAPGLLERLRAALDAAISEVGASPPPGGLRSAVLIQALQALPEVRRVVSLELASDPKERFHPWHLPLPRRGARLHRASEIRLSHRGLALQPPPPVNPSQLAAAAAPKSPAAVAATTAIPAGRRRSFRSPSSVARQVPAVYGVGPAGLPADASQERRGQALQLRAYLHFFDQLLANGQAQLAHAAQLLGPVATNDPHPLDGEAVGLAHDRDLPLTDLSDLLQGRPEHWPQALRQALQASAPAAAAHQRADLLAHLLGRFGEALELDAVPSSNGGSATALVMARSALLRRIVPLTAGRGSGPDLLTADPLAAATANPSAPPTVAEANQGAFAERLRRKLGLPLDPDGTPPLLVIEHLLLRPLQEDSSQQVQDGEDPIPFLSDVPRPDPWSGRVSVAVHATRLPGTATPARDRWLVHHLRQELPAHLQAELLLLADSPTTPGQGPWSEMLAAWQRFRALLQSQRLAGLSGAGSAEAGESQLRLLRLRDSRDRLVSLLRLGLPWPLRAIPLPEQLMVAPGKQGAITLPYSQRGIRYQLVEVASGAAVGEPALGTDDALTLTTSPISKDITLRVQASVLPPSGTSSAAAAKTDTKGVALTANGRARSTLLSGEIRVVVGIELGLPVRLLDAASRSRLPLLDPSGVANNDGLARLVPHGQQLLVEIDASQEGVKYQVIDNTSKTPLSAEVPGNTRTLHLPLNAAATEDQDLAVRARLEKRRAQDQNQLAALLPLRVKANPNVPLQPSAKVVAAEADAEIQIGVMATKEAAALASQASVHYQLRTRELRIDPGNPMVDEWKLNNPLWLVQPPRPVDPLKPVDPTARQRALEGFPEATAGPGSKGNGQQLIVKHPIRGEGFVVAALARKEHRLHPLSHDNEATLPSAVPLTQAAVVYAKPEATRHLLLRPDPDRPGLWTLEGGQPGVAYTLKDDKGNTLARELPIPEVDEAQAKRQGIGYQRVGRDLIVGLSDAPARAVAAFTLDPEAISTLKVEARYLRSGVTVELVHPPTLAPASSPPDDAAAVVAQIMRSRGTRKLPTIPPPEAFSQVLTTRTGEGNLELLLLGADGSVWQSSQMAPMEGWSAPLGLGGSGYQQLVAGWSRDGRQQVFAVGPDQAAWHNVQIDAQAGGWAGWTSLGGSIKQLAVASNADGRLELFGIGVKNGPLWVLPQTPPDDAWSTWTSLAGGITEIKAGRNSDGRLEVFVVGTNKATYHIWQQEPGARWTGWVSLAGNCRCLDLETNEDGRMQVFVIGGDKALYHRLQTQAGESTGWDPWTKLGGSTQRIASAKHLDGRLTVFAVGADQQLSCLSQTAPGKGWGTWANLGGAVAQVSAEPSADGRMQVFAIGTDGGVWQIGQKEPNGGWNDWTKLF
ncbi:MAG: hypothetical protein ACK54Z_05990 [Cyanobacteriota bacterium]